MNHVTAAGTERDFVSLSLADLLEARDLYHWHLLNQSNVVGTAIGLYLIRKNAPWPDSGKTVRQATFERAGSRKGPRTFSNSEVRDYSWPCVIVLVSEWYDPADFDATDPSKPHPRQILPKTLFMPDGRSVPVCAVKVEPATSKPTTIPKWHWPAARIGPGYPIVVVSQGRERVASVGCLVSDGHTTYALTNRHVAGAPGQEIFSYLAGNRVRIGRTSKRQATRIPFGDAYPDFSCRRTFTNLDVGLVELDDLSRWTTRVYGIGSVGELADLHEGNLRLDLVNARVVASGAASGGLSGTIKALFYRYKSVGGYDYVTDFLIAPGDTNKQTQPGDSGTVWHIVPTDPKLPIRPIAVEWGGQALVEAGVPAAYHFTLATNLSSIFRHLNVELVRSGSVTAQPYWGQMGHYSIATFACSALQSTKLSKLMAVNKDRISFVDEDLKPATIKEALKRAQEDDFCPLADVPDVVWKKTPHQIKGGRDQPEGRRSTGPEHPTHYADIDEPRERDGKTLRELCLADPRRVDVGFWQSFYDEQGHTDQKSRGLLPFRVWQFFDEMVDAVRSKKLDRFVAAAGLVSHYVGDACQPLHGSMYADGYADQETDIEHRKEGTDEIYTEKSHVGAGVHSAYETSMIDRYAGEIVRGLSERAGRKPKKLPPIRTGHQAAMAVIHLMDRAAKAIAPRDIVDTFIDAGGTNSVAVYDALWDRFGTQTIHVMWDGAQVLATVWEGAWAAGGGEKIGVTELKARSLSKLKALYENPKFVPSLDLDAIAKVLEGTAPVRTTGRSRERAANGRGVKRRATNGARVLQGAAT
jgi:S1/P1 Nuclease